MHSHKKPDYHDPVASVVTTERRHNFPTVAHWIPNVLRLSLLLSSTFSCLAWAEEADNELDVIKVQAPKYETTPAGASVLDPSLIDSLAPATSDTASLLRDIPGMSLYGAGGVSSLPSIHGLADDRVRTQVDGVDLIASCPNHMNAALSYIDPTHVGSAVVYAGITPVRVGGDSLGGSIVVESPEPEFAAPGTGLLSKGELGVFYRSNGNGKGANAAFTLAGEHLSLNYAGSSAQSENYKAGGDFKTYADSGRPGHTLARDEVGSTAYKSRNRNLGVAYRVGAHLFEARYSDQDIPYELYPNQRMDLLDNSEHRLNLHYLGQLDWGTLDARIYHSKVDHYMDFGADKKLDYGPAINTTLHAVGMPMYTQGTTDGAKLQTDIPLTERDLLRLGAELQRYRLDDWWPPSPDCIATDPTCSGGMAPNTFWNIKHGERDRTAVFGEWEAQWNSRWLTLVGLRTEEVRTDTGDIQSYNDAGMMYTGSSAGTRQDFNNLDRERTDYNLDITLLARDTVDATRTFEFGIAQKTRSPNLYERYAWSTNTMAMEMVNFAGDGNGYVGDPDLDPEVARTVSVTGDWHSADRRYELKITPYYTRVTDYIDVVRRPTSTSMMGSDQNAERTTGFVKLQYANQSARLYGMDIAGKMPLGNTHWGEWGAAGLVNYTRGKNQDSGDGLYNIMPLNTRLTLSQELGSWSSAIEFIAVANKHDLSEVRNELETAGYALLNLRGSYTWSQVRVDFGIENLFDRDYEMPLGGAYTGQGSTMSFNRELGGTMSSPSIWGTPVPGPGRSFYCGLNISF